MKKYKIIYADPPWRFRVWNGKTGVGRTAEEHYESLSIEKLMSLKVPADDDCILFLWATRPMPIEALALINYWGFTFKTEVFTWVKTLKNNPLQLHWGMGFWSRANTEGVYLATKGDIKRINKGVHQVIEERWYPDTLYYPIDKHSKKPNEVQNRIIQLIGSESKIELFARQKTEGWDVWGNEIENDIELEWGDEEEAKRYWELVKLVFSKKYNLLYDENKI